MVEARQAWLWVDCGILGWIVFTAVAAILKGWLLVDVFYVPGVFAYAAIPWDLLLFAGFMLFLMPGSTRQAPLVALFAAGFYDSTVSIPAQVFNPSHAAPLYFMNYVVWGLMLAVPLLALRPRPRIRALAKPLAVYLVATSFFTAVVTSLYAAMLYEAFACYVAFILFVHEIEYE